MTTGSTRPAAAGSSAVPGSDAETPTQIPKRGWFQIVRRAWKQTKADNIPLLAAGVAFYAFMALFPTLIAAVLLYGLFADPADVARQVESMSKSLPEGADKLIGDQLTSLASTSNSALSIGLVISIALALWSASSGVGNLMTALNTCYREEETRGFVKRKGLSLVLTLGAILFISVAVAAIAVVPAVANIIGVGEFSRVIVDVVRWVGLVVAFLLALAILYRVAADRDAPRFRWASIGAVVATVVWVIASVGFSLYVDNFGSYGKTYGSLAGVVVLLLWLWITSLIVLVGAEINAEAEQQTAADTTSGQPQSLGRRGAVVADSTPGSTD